MFNIGVEGQYLLAMAVATLAAVSFGFPGVLHSPSRDFAIHGGMADASIPAVLKVKTGAHEVVTTIMMNGVAIELVAWALHGPFKSSLRPASSTQSPDRLFPSQRDRAQLGTFGVGIDVAPLPGCSPWRSSAACRLVPPAADPPRDTRPAPSVGPGFGAGGRHLDRLGPDQGLPDLWRARRPGGHAADLGRTGHLPLNYQALGFTGIAVAFLGQNNPIGIIFSAIMWGSCRAEDAVHIKTGPASSSSSSCKAS